MRRLRVECRKYSRALQRDVTDFGADASFREGHARRLAAWELKGEIKGAELLIAEMDGSMVAIVEFGEKKEGIDDRTNRKVCWKEAKLWFVRAQNKIDRVLWVCHRDS